MSLMRRRRLERLEARQPRGPIYTDPTPTVMRLWVDLRAVTEGKTCWIPRRERELTDEQRDAFDRAVRNTDLMNARLTAERAREI
jgi:hypothetical protein